MAQKGPVLCCRCRCWGKPPEESDAGSPPPPHINHGGALKRGVRPARSDPHSAAHLRSTLRKTNTSAEDGRTGWMDGCADVDRCSRLKQTKSTSSDPLVTPCDISLAKSASRITF
ncbi:hypothetical protein GBF38_023264 [Nibea albiflora]|uniref:Uncharacterized protein n=1 Tax=Nibea albiflora TaxID=240163 RepID=A0ACB7EYV3_NIBAL|nr:hypothetical protein GBF38_023264 [Nibea albiflora]